MNITLNHQPFCSKTYKNNTQTTVFTSNYTKIAGGQAPYFTYFFRTDLKWKSFAKYLQRHFSNADKVNVYNCACSDGTEPFTLLMSLIGKLGKQKSEKFSPIIAFDANEELIKNANSGIIPLLPKRFAIVDIYKLKFKNFFKEHRFLKYVKQGDGSNAVKMNDEIRKGVNFKTANVLTDVENIKGKNTVFMCRNMWMYLSQAEQEKLASMLGKKMEKNSVVVLGEYDLEASSAVELLMKNGFEETYIDKVYEKMV